jgi:predicted LPLAT superfamily acyltransferase
MLRPLGGVAGRRPEWVERPERGSRLAVLVLSWLTLKLGRPVGRALLYPICAYFVLFSPRARRASAEYLRRVLGRRPGLGDVFRHYHAFASTAHDRIYFLAGKYSTFEVTLSAPAGLLARLRQGRGCILLGAHLGSFEVLRARSVSDRMPPVSVLMHLDNTEKANSVLHRLAPGIESRIIPLGGPASLLRVRECLARGEIVGMLGDRAWRNERSCSCEFLGGQARFPLGPWLLAGLLEAPVVLCFGLYLGGRRYEVHLEPFADAIPLESRSREAAVRPWVERYAHRLEHYCRLAPHNWFNFYDYWE